MYNYQNSVHYPLSSLLFEIWVFFETGFCLCLQVAPTRLGLVPQTGTNSADWIQPSRYNLKTEIIQSPKPCFI
jgi:hypothetical protein